jgi:hypothetical protein
MVSALNASSGRSTHLLSLSEILRLSGGNKQVAVSK